VPVQRGRPARRFPSCQSKALASTAAAHGLRDESRVPSPRHHFLTARLLTGRLLAARLLTGCLLTGCPGSGRFPRSRSSCSRSSYSRSFCSLVSSPHFWRQKNEGSCSRRPRRGAGPTGPLGHLDLVTTATGAGRPTLRVRSRRGAGRLRNTPIRANFLPRNLTAWLDKFPAMACCAVLRVPDAAEGCAGSWRRAGRNCRRRWP
jgi:hypothetical protein